MFYKGLFILADFAIIPVEARDGSGGPGRSLRLGDGTADQLG